MAEKKLRLGGMALANGVLVHGPTSWACAVRTSSGEVKVASGEKPRLNVSADTPLLRGPARLLEAMLVLPRVRRRLPEARFAFERRNVLASMAAAGVAARAIRESERLSPAAQELVGGVSSLAPALIALRGGELAGYHGAEHISIGTYEHGEGAKKEHERCGSHLVGPLILASAAGAGLAARVPERLRKPASLVASLGAFAASTEMFGWMVRNPEHPVARLLAWPGTELQSRIATADPSPEQVEVAQAALGACLEREHAALAGA
ncbi:MAG TPA: DUF1385 domain-containing protein [Gaiellaceae bacterium]|nr:DUF1385 domain-containing protein [Gaiellaceae bacterium]